MLSVRLATLFQPRRRLAAAPVVLRSAARSHVGTRRTLNEDRVLDRAAAGLWAVADGMGGHAGGDVAAEAAVRALGEAADGAAPLSDAAVQAALCRANAAIHASAGHRQSGTTIVVLRAEPGWATILWAGDSRAYRLRGDALVQLTRDHSLVQTLVEAGAVAPEDAERHPHANVVTRALGVGATVAIDTCESEVLAGDVFLLCSDGLSKACRPAEIARLLAARVPVGAAADALVAAALARDGSDNISALVVRAD